MCITLMLIMANFRTVILAVCFFAAVNDYSNVAAADTIGSSALKNLHYEPQGNQKESATISTIRPISIRYTASFSKIWDDWGSDAHDDIRFWRPHSDCTFYPLGDAAVGDYDDVPDNPSVLVSANLPGALAPPLHFEEVWRDEDSGVDDSVKILKMIPPAGFTCLGYVAHEDDDYEGYPDRDLFRCVNSDYVSYAGSFQEVWLDVDSGAKHDVGIWDHYNQQKDEYIHANTFSAFKNHNQPGGNPPLLLSSKTHEITCGWDLPERYKPIFKFDRDGDDYCYPQEPTSEHNGDCNSVLSDSEPMFYQEKQCGDFITYTYWVWYGWQKECISGQGSHDNDWEHITVYITKACNINHVVFHQHAGHYTRRLGTYNNVGDRPIVYVGKISHGSYHDYCTGVCSFEEFFTEGCLGSVNYCQGGCGYWDDFRNPGPSWEGVLTPLQAGETINGIDRPDRTVCVEDSCEGSDDRILTTAGCWQDDD